MSKALKDELDNYKTLVDQLGANPDKVADLMSSLSVIISETKRTATITGFSEESIKSMLIIAFTTGMDNHG